MNPAPLDQQQKLRKASTTRFRMKRFSVFLNVLASIPELDRPLRILDVGGVEAYWSDKQNLIARPIEVTLLNLNSAGTTRSNFFSVAGNACSMPEFESERFDVVHSNSVIEHVGKWSDMMAMANEVRRVASAYFVQMPYFWFPIEPHARTPFFHWLPESLRFRMMMTRDRGFYKRCNTVDEAMRTIQEAAMLDKKMFSALFPDGEIISERYFGLTKSLMAVRYAMPRFAHESE
jgi:hypothetical protein